VTEIPAAPGPEWLFAAPPTWTAPPGFDPRKGYVVDPTWPPAPDSDRSCRGGSAQYRVAQEVADYNDCPASINQYLDSKQDGSTRYQCLEPLTGN
jgi:hypothetical protein